MLSMIGLPEEALAIAFSRSMLTFRYRLCFSKGKNVSFSGGNLRFIKGMPMLFSQSEQTNKQTNKKQT